jgi:hypothetical protein
MRDATETPTVLKSCTTNAFTALQFLFLDSDHYLTILDIDPQEFRRRLIEQMYQKGGMREFTEMHKRCFRANYRFWYTRQGLRKFSDKQEEEYDPRKPY